MRDPATAPSTMTSRSIDLATKQAERRALARDVAFWIFVPWIVASLALLALIVFLPGCTSSTAKTEADVIREADVLLRNHAHPELPKWEEARIKFLADEQSFLQPKPSPSPTPGVVK